MKDDYTMKHVCNWYNQDGSTVEYKIEDWVKMVYHYRIDWTRRKAEYERGGWINF
jgi:hypothetical protein